MLDAGRRKPRTGCGSSRKTEQTEQAKQHPDVQVDDFQRSWNDHVERARARIDARKAQHDAKVAQHDADAAAAYADFTIDFAYSAIEEAEYAVLDAVLARMDAEASGSKVPS